MKRIVLAWAALGLLGATAARIRPAQDASAISVESLRSRLTAFSHDSMEGRLTGSRGLERATRFIIAELAAAHVSPAGDGGTYLQSVPIVRRQLDLAGAKATDAAAYIPGVDFIPLVGVFGLGTPDSVRIGKSRYVAGGQLGAPDATPPAKVSGDFVVFLPPRRSNGQPDYQLWDMRGVMASYRGAGALFVATLDLMPRAFVERVAAPRLELLNRFAAPPAMPPVIAMTRGTARKAVNSLASLSYTTRQSPLEFQAHNVVAVVQGSDPKLKSEFVVLSAHLDHLGFATALEREGTDSVFNGADAGSGAVALLAIAEYFQTRPVRPKRSIVFVWTTGSAQGLLGAEYFADRPTVPRDSIVANIAVDRIGRNGAGETQLHATGARRLSAEFGGVVDAVNARDGVRFALDAPEAEGDRKPMPLCSGDEWHFWRWGIPAVRISIGPHADENRVSDKIGTINFDNYARVARYVVALAEAVAERPARPRVDVARPDPHALCAR